MHNNELYDPNAIEISGITQLLVYIRSNPSWELQSTVVDLLQSRKENIDRIKTFLKQGPLKVVKTYRNLKHMG